MRARDRLRKTLKEWPKLAGKPIVRECWNGYQVCARDHRHTRPHKRRHVKHCQFIPKDVMRVLHLCPPNKSVGKGVAWKKLRKLVENWKDSYNRPYVRVFKAGYWLCGYDCDNWLYGHVQHATECRFVRF